MKKNMLIAVFLLGITTNMLHAQEWKSVCKNDHTEYLVNTGCLQEAGKYISYDIKEVFLSESDKAEYIRKKINDLYHDYTLSPQSRQRLEKQWHNYDHQVLHYIANRQDQTHTCVSFANLDKNGKIIEEFVFTTPNWECDAVSRNICYKYKFEYKK